jgi:hypothetical protein
MDKLAGGGSFDRARVPYAQGVHLLCPSPPHGKAVNPPPNQPASQHQPASHPAGGPASMPGNSTPR